MNVDTDQSAPCCSIVAPGITRAEADQAAATFKALADPGRVRLINLLAGSNEPVCVCDLTAQLGLAQGTVSFHLKKLLQAGLVEREQRGTWAYYSLRREALASLGEIFAEGVRR
jgi:ArsR family transcriptional regulator